ncbi:MAG: UMP kinase [Desulfurococcaceae archaeon]
MEMCLVNIIVIKLTGKVFDEPQLLKSYIELFKKLIDKWRLLIVTGGGSLARRYIEVARSIGVESNYWLDEIGILASRLNSYLLISALQPYSYPRPVTTLSEAVEATSIFKIVVMGGLIPTQSTASTLLEVAEALGVKDVIYVSAIDRVYDKDPLKYPDAEGLIEIDASKLIEMIEQSILPGEYALIDVKALEIAIRSGIRIHVVGYRNVENIDKVLRGENPGTIINPR